MNKRDLINIHNAPLSVEEAALYLDVSKGHLDNLRYRGTGPKFYKPSGKRIYYFVSDLDRWIREGDE